MLLMKSSLKSQMDMVINTRSGENISVDYHPHSQKQKSMNIIMTILIVSGIDQKQGTDALRLALSTVMDGMMQ